MKRKYLGRIVTMDAAFTVIERGALFVDADHIVAAQDADAPQPEGFDDIAPVDTGGTIYPGLIELHNHITYNILKLWNVPERFADRAVWRGPPAGPPHAEYWQLVKKPMSLIQSTPDPLIVPSIARYVEAKCLFSGVTTSQGVSLTKDGVPTFYRGIVRNVEDATNPADLPAADTEINDIDPAKWDDFDKRLNKSSSFLLHLAEGGSVARQYFLALKSSAGAWAINNKLSGIHCGGLNEADLATLAQYQGSLVWSPLSNMLLYGQTANISAALKNGITLALGSDWSPSGSKNLLGELKVARIFRDEHKLSLSDRDLVAMVTTNPARMVKWHDSLGSLVKGKRADFLVLTGTGADCYRALLDAKENDIALVVIDGEPMHGRKEIMDQMGIAGEAIKIGGADYIANFSSQTADPRMKDISFDRATQVLTDILHRVPELAHLPPAKRSAFGRPLNLEEHSPFRIALDVDDPPPTPGSHELSMKFAKDPDPPPPLIPLKLDAPTMVDDPTFMVTIKQERNLGESIKAGLEKIYG